MGYFKIQRSESIPFIKNQNDSSIGGICCTWPRYKAGITKNPYLALTLDFGAKSHKPNYQKIERKNHDFLALKILKNRGFLKKITVCNLQVTHQILRDHWNRTIDTILEWFRMHKKSFNLLCNNFFQRVPVLPHNLKVPK